MDLISHDFNVSCSCPCFCCIYKLDVLVILTFFYLFITRRLKNMSDSDLPLVPAQPGSLLENDDDSSRLATVSSSSSNIQPFPDAKPVKKNTQPTSPSTCETIEKELHQLRESLRNETYPTIDFSSLTSSSSAYSTLRRKVIKPDIDLNLSGSSSEEDDNTDDNDHEPESQSDIDSNSAIRTSSLSQTSHSFSDSNEDDIFSTDSGPFSIDIRPSTRCKQRHASRRSASRSIDSETPIVHEAVEISDYDLSLSFRELRHIRKALARAELDSIGLTRRTKEDIRKGKLCSACLKTRFRIFGSWPVRCRLCERPVCGRCSTVVAMSNKRYNRIPVKLLVPKNSMNMFNMNNNNNNNNNNIKNMSSGNQQRTSQAISRSDSGATNTASSSSSQLTAGSVVDTEEEEEYLVGSKANDMVTSESFNNSRDTCDSASLADKISLNWSWMRSNSQKSLDDGSSQMMLKLCKECEMFIVTVMAID